MGRTFKRVTVVAALLAVVLGASVVVGTGYFARNSPSASARACAPAAAVTVGKIVVPAGPIAGYCQDRLINAAYVMMAARSLGIGPHTQAIGVMTALGESGLRVLDHGDAAGPDSRGLFQQRDNGAWGSYADRMDPYTSALNFFRKLVSIPGWKDLSPGEAAHTVQVNADPKHYDPYLPRAEAIVAALGS